ncbi:hypothetical protein FDH34_gp184 [Serratia phage BF]|uniref:Uncharacterized protein n=1 Tax=Serratia phage BF TaxID=1962671 RepID=A0A1S6UBB8_9CAUD|nr:hypothetical protein FDH34_gp184 [Serratia phage BF]AQW88709.1 hypothetical protein BF_0184 [Serratia phage BF]
MTNMKYKIRNKKTFLYIDDIYSDGDRSSMYGRIFDSHAIAQQFLYERQHELFEMNQYLDISNYTIDEYHLSLSRSIAIYNTVEEHIMNSPDNEGNVKKVKAMLHQCILHGFSCISTPFFDFLLTSDKYEPILLELVPPHILHSVNDFMDVGIMECDLDELGAISLTATTEQIKMNQIVEILRARSEKVSK